MLRSVVDKRSVVGTGAAAKGQRRFTLKSAVENQKKRRRRKETRSRTSQSIHLGENSRRGKEPEGRLSRMLDTKRRRGDVVIPLNSEKKRVHSASHRAFPPCPVPRPQRPRDPNVTLAKAPMLRVAGGLGSGTTRFRVHHWSDEANAQRFAVENKHWSLGWEKGEWRGTNVKTPRLPSSCQHTCRITNSFRVTLMT